MVMTLIFYGVIAAALYRIYQMGSDVAEIRELLKAIKRNTELANPAPAAVAAEAHNSPEALVRAVHAASYQELDSAIADQAADAETRP